MPTNPRAITLLGVVLKRYIDGNTKARQLRHFFDRVLARLFSPLCLALRHSQRNVPPLLVWVLTGIAQAVRALNSPWSAMNRLVQR